LDENRTKNGARTAHILPAFADQAKYMPRGMSLGAWAFLLTQDVTRFGPYERVNAPRKHCAISRELC